MTDASADLLRILEAEEALYARMRDLLQGEWELMIELDADALERTAREKAELADEGRLLEETRQVVARGLAADLGLAAERPTLSELCARLGRGAGPLREVHTRLLILVSVVRELLDANEALAGESLSQVRGTLRLLGGLVPGEALYDARNVSTLEPGRLVRQQA